MKIGAIIIGDELLSGKRQDKHLAALIRLLAERGMKLDWVEYLGDNPQRLQDSLQRAFASHDLVFSFGGIGATPDDYTRQCAAQAQGVALAIHPEARAIIEGRFGDEAYPHRINMGNIPVGARLIPNPVNQMPGFSCRDVHFVPGFPSMAWPMIAWVLDTLYPQLKNSAPDVEQTVIALDAREGDLITLMQDFSQRYPALRLSSLPNFGNEAISRMHIEFGFSGPASLVGIAMAEWCKALQAAGYRLLDRQAASL
ncbi:competence/damage-inducible protein A [Craterilacuibacter sp.]|uniref:competence/damage-inducible protein A n=1 Tax=Craterilacuibacter sp. TaxID=2870909 RepID=UPI003F39C153